MKLTWNWRDYAINCAIYISHFAHCVAWPIAGPELGRVVVGARHEDVAQGMPVEAPDGALVRLFHARHGCFLAQVPEEDGAVPAAARQQVLVHGVPRQG